MRAERTALGNRPYRLICVPHEPRTMRDMGGCEEWVLALEIFRH